MKTFPIFTAVLTLVTTSVLHAAPYTGWMNDYTGAEANTLLLWKFDNTGTPGSPVYTYDSSGGGYTAWIQATNTQTGVAGKFGTAFRSGPGRSTGDDAWVRTGGASTPADVFNDSALSVEFWFSPEADGINALGGYFFDKKYTANAGISLTINTEKQLTLSVGNKAGTASSNLTSSVLDWEAGVWYHIAVTYENIDGDGYLKIFRDGVSVGNPLTPPAAGFGDIGAGSYQWRLANRLGSSFGSVPGYYDNFRVSSVAYNYAVPEPTVAGLLLLATGAFLLQRKRKA